MHHGFTKPVNHLVTIGLFTVSLFMSSAHAQMIDTQTLVNNAQTEQDRRHIQDALNRDDVTTKLHDLGVDPAEIQARVDSLTDAEAQTLAKNIDALPAGGRIDNVTLLLIILIIILLV